MASVAGNNVTSLVWKKANVWRTLRRRRPRRGGELDGRTVDGRARRAVDEGEKNPTTHLSASRVRRSVSEPNVSCLRADRRKKNCETSTPSDRHRHVEFAFLEQKSHRGKVADRLRSHVSTAMFYGRRSRRVNAFE